jgi:hypothetical protein
MIMMPKLRYNNLGNSNKSTSSCSVEIFLSTATKNGFCTTSLKTKHLVDFLFTNNHK